MPNHPLVSVYAGAPRFSGFLSLGGILPMRAKTWVFLKEHSSLEHNFIFGKCIFIAEVQKIKFNKIFLEEGKHRREVLLSVSESWVGSGLEVFMLL